MCYSARMLLEQLRAIDSAVDEFVRGCDALAVSGADAARLVPVLSSMKNKIAALEASLGHRAVDANVHVTTGARDGATWLASATGTSVGEARQSLEMTSRLQTLPQVEDAF